MIDLVRLELRAGNGGDGKVSFRREKYVPKGGPDGGDGGHGGSIILKASPKHATLRHLAGLKVIEAQHGQGGGKRQKSGHKGADTILEVPVGTTVWLVSENQVSHQHRAFPRREGKLRFKAARQKYFLVKDTQPKPLAPQDVIQLEPELEWVANQSMAELDIRQVPKEQLITLDEPGQEYVIVQGGEGGRGNTAFKSPSHTTPLDAEFGVPGERKLVFLEQKLLADVGLVGFPNAGKSTLISVVSNAKPKTANYPFTTIEPNLGIVEFSDQKETESLVIADLPGLVEGAHQGKGLGHQFLRHVENCRQLVIVLALDEITLGEESLSDRDKAQLLYNQYQQLQDELSAYSDIIIEKEQQVVVNKIDLYSPELLAEMTSVFEKQGLRPQFISAATQENVQDFKNSLRG